MSLPIINFGGELQAEDGQAAILLSQVPSAYAGASDWYNVSVYDAATVVTASGNTGWTIIQVNDTGVLRAEAEAGVVNPTPVVQNKSESNRIVLAFYGDGSVSKAMYTDDPSIVFAPGYYGLVSITNSIMTYPDGSKALVNSVITGFTSPT